MQPQDVCVLIPSLSPDEKLPRYVDSLIEAGFGLILVVNDGSAPEYDAIFDCVAQKERCHVLRHPVNRGKGQALRTGFDYVLQSTAYQGVITADSDGQHTTPDTLRLCAALKTDSARILLGSRDFSRRNKRIPARSRFGNRVTSAVFALTNGKWLPDTQTGLRAIPRASLQPLLSVQGDRFEYEMNMLIHCAQHHIPMEVIPIETIYLEENKSSHFHPLRDSYRIYKLLLGGFVRFSAASLLSFILEYGLLSLIMYLLFAGDNGSIAFLGLLFSHRALIASPIARVISAPVNFILNQRFAFRIRACRGAAGRYALLAAAMLVVSTLLFGYLNHFIPARLEGLSLVLKMLIDLVLYLVNYRVQRDWVFRK